VLTAAIGLFFLTRTTPTPQILPQPEQTTPSSQPEEVTASFEIQTLGTKRIFTSSMYHNQSDNVYISADNPNQVHVKKTGVTWADFFATLPMKLTHDCLTTGTGQTFCTNASYELKFFINDKEEPNALDQVIKDEDRLFVSYE